MFKALINNESWLVRLLQRFTERVSLWEVNMTNQLYITGTILWFIALAQVADFNLLDHMTDLAGNVLIF